MAACSSVRFLPAPFVSSILNGSSSANRSAHCDLDRWEQGVSGSHSIPTLPPIITCTSSIQPEPGAQSSGAIHGIQRELYAGNSYSRRHSRAFDHNSGILQFGPDGKLYISTGDGDNTATSQNLTSLNGKILRLNPDGSTPSDNPFISNANPNVKKVFSFGHRNSFGFTFHGHTGHLWQTENGPERQRRDQSHCRRRQLWLAEGDRHRWQSKLPRSDLRL